MVDVDDDDNDGVMVGLGSDVGLGGEVEVGVDVVVPVVVGGFVVVPPPPPPPVGTCPCIHAYLMTSNVHVLTLAVTVALGVVLHCVSL